MPRRLSPILGLLLPLAACTDGQAGTPPVERSDSAGVELVRTLGPDRPLEWRFEPILTLGGKESGPEAFYGVGNFGVAADSAGHIYVLDGGNGQVQVFAADGTPLRSMGRRGGGPGELGQFVYAMAVAPDGAVGVFDFQKQSVVRWDPTGQLLPAVSVQGQPSGGIRMLEDGAVAAAFQDHDFQGDSARYVLRVIAPDGTTQDLAGLVLAGMHPVSFDCVSISGMTPLFQPAMEFDAAAGAFLLARSAAYRIEVRDRDGSVRRVLSRDVEPVPATEELARIEADSMRINFGGGGGCTIPAEKVVEQRGFEAVVPAVRELIGTPDGGVWVQRGYGPSPRRRIDVFDADGAYVGTLPAGTPWPAAFLDEHTIVVAIEDDFERDLVEVRRIVWSP